MIYCMNVPRPCVLAPEHFGPLDLAERRLRSPADTAVRIFLRSPKGFNSSWGPDLTERLGRGQPDIGFLILQRSNEGNSGDTIRNY